MKKEDLLLVFDFLATALKEETESKLPEVTSTKIINEVETPTQKYSVNLEDRTSTTHIKELMDKLDAKAKIEAETKNQLATQKRNFETIIKQIKEDQTNNFLIDKQLAEEEAPIPTGRITSDEPDEIPQVRFRPEFRGDTNGEAVEI